MRLIDPFNKSNIHSFPLLTTYSAFEILLETFSFNDVNSGKLYMLDLLKGSIHGRLRYFSLVLYFSCTFVKFLQCSKENTFLDYFCSQMRCFKKYMSFTRNTGQICTLFCNTMCSSKEIYRLHVQKG